MATVEIKCTVKNLYKNCPKPDGWTGFFAVSRKYGDIQVTGKPSFIIEKGMVLDITAKQVADNKFEAIEFSVHTKSKTAIINYLSGSNFPGIGYVIASKIYDCYGNDSIVMIKNHPEVVAKDVGLSDRQMKTLTSVVNDPVTDIKAIFPVFTAKQIKDILDTYVDSNGKTDVNTVIKLIKNNPYQLMDSVKNIPFNTVDEVAIRILRFRLDDERRMRFIIKYTIINWLKETGDNYIEISDNTEFNKLTHDFMNTLKVHEDDDNKAMQWFGDILETEAASEKPLIYIDRCYDENNVLTEVHLYTMNGWKAQCNIIDCVHDRLNCQTSNFMKEMSENNQNTSVLLTTLNRQTIKMSGHPISSEQLSAIQKSLENQISVITGGPGRGKTATINHICDIYEQQCIVRHAQNINRTTKILSGIRKLILCAPTGRAAKNLTDYTGRTAFTVAKILTETAASTDNMRAIESHLRNGLAIIDECSMINQSDMAEILKLFTKLNMQIILVGDVNQLPPIEPGRPFKDIIQSNKVVVSKLTVCFRTKIQFISDNADLIINGNRNIQLSPDFMVLDYPDENMCGNVLINTFLGELKKPDDIKEVVLLCGLKKGKSGTDALNMRLQAQLNPQHTTATQKYDTKRARYYFDDRGVDINETYFRESETNKSWSRIRVGDRVMRTENDYNIDRSIYDSKLEEPVIPSTGLFNGDCGTVVRYYPYVNKDKPAMIVVALDDGSTSFIKCDSEEVNSCKLTLGYASTIHKAQGCEYRTVILAMPLRLSQVKNNFGCRNLLYTAITRAKQSVCILGDQTALNSCIDTEALPRKSTMAARI